MKKFITTLLAVTLLVSLCACGSNSDSSKDEAQKKSNRDELMSFNIEINGTALTLPFEYSQFTELGYSLIDDEELAPNTYSIGSYVKNDNGESLNVQFWNNSKDTKKYSECQICQIETTLNKSLTVTLAGDIKFDEKLTPKKVIKTYGEPDYDFDEEDFQTLSYEDGSFKQVKFMFYKKGSMKEYNTLTINHIEN